MAPSTRAKNKLAHPAALVMTNAAKQKAGIKTKARPKKFTNAERVRWLETRLAELEGGDEEMASQEPLVRIFNIFIIETDIEKHT